MAVCRRFPAWFDIVLTGLLYCCLYTCFDVETKRPRRTGGNLSIQRRSGAFVEAQVLPDWGVVFRRRNILQRGCRRFAGAVLVCRPIGSLGVAIKHIPPESFGSCSPIRPTLQVFRYRKTGRLFYRESRIRRFVFDIAPASGGTIPCFDVETVRS